MERQLGRRVIPRAKNPPGRTVPRGVWESRSPWGDVNSRNPAQQGGSFISLDCSPKGNSGSWGRTAFVILTPFHCLSNLNSPPGPLHMSSYYGVPLPLVRVSWQGVVRKYCTSSSEVQFPENTCYFIREHNEKTQTVSSVWF